MLKIRTDRRVTAVICGTVLCGALMGGCGNEGTEGPETTTAAGGGANTTTAGNTTAGNQVKTPVAAGGGGRPGIVDYAKQKAGTK